MIEVALFTGVGLLGYILATQYNDESKNKLQPQGREGFEDAVSPPRSAITQNDSVSYSQSDKGHNNMVPFFGAKVTQNMRAGATNSILDTFAGTGNEYFQKREVSSFYDVVPGQGLVFGNANESDFMQSRMVAGNNMKNVFPIEQTRVAPGINDGYNNLGSGGYQQFNATQEFAKPRTTDELRTANKPKLSYDSPVIPGSHFITQPGLQAPVLKNRPDTFQVLTDKDTGELMYLNTTTGAQVAPASFPEQMFKEQQRQTTSVEYYGSGGASFTFANYTPGGYTAINGGEAQVGAVKVNKDEDMLINTRQHVDPANVVSQPSTTEQQGVYRYNEPLPQDQQIRNMDPSILDAFRSNPYTQSLTSIA